jgi:hypothetical protein
MNDTSVWGTARKMIEIYGREAQFEATRRRTRALERDDQEDFERWDYIAAAIGRNPARGGTTLNS